jgi:radical SAM/Cys-rich protein
LIQISTLPNDPDDPVREILPFHLRLKREGIRLTRSPLLTLQINLGKLCNQACVHCHVEAGPRRQEIMTEATVDRILDLARSASSVETVDITGGAPELNPHFRKLVAGLRSIDKTLIDRCNLTVLLTAGLDNLAEFLADNQVWIIASLPCYSRDNVDSQRGKGVFEVSIEALRLLNSLGYAAEAGPLRLDLVYNPTGPFLPPDQSRLEAEYRSRLAIQFGIRFNNLYTITNMPIRRFRHFLERSGELQAYMRLLEASFNPAAASKVMCQSLLSIGWDGQIYDCDFNQMLDLPAGRSQRTIWEIESLDQFDAGGIAFDDHCYGCAAGPGSSCGGALI